MRFVTRNTPIETRHIIRYHERKHLVDQKNTAEYYAQLN